MKIGTRRLAPLMVITDGTARSDLARVVEAALKGGAGMVQLREKHSGAAEVLAMARTLRDLTREHDAALIINDRIDVAREAAADGVHLGWRSPPVDHARRRLGDEALIGVSVHKAQEAKRAADDGADYVVFGPIYDTPSKRGLVAPQGIVRLAECVAAGSIPVIAVGGITPARVPEIMGAGAAGVAVMRGVMEAPSPEAATREYLVHCGAGRP